MFVLFFSSTLSLSAVIPPEPNLQGVIGVSDWDFLRPPSAPEDEDDHITRPSLDDFDGEIAVFQVGVSFLDMHSRYNRCVLLGDPGSAEEHREGQ